MLTLALYGVVAIGVIGALFLLAVRFLPAGEQLSHPVRDEPVWTLPPERKLNATDVADVRLPVALRGYRFAETDELLDRLVDEIRSRDNELDRLYGLLIAADVPAHRAAPDESVPDESVPDESVPAESVPAESVPAESVPAEPTAAGPPAADATEPTAEPTDGG